MIPVPSGVQVWLATGHTDMRKGFDGLALLVQETLRRNPHNGHLFVFRGRRGSLIKVLWHDGQGVAVMVGVIQSPLALPLVRRSVQPPLTVHPVIKRGLFGMAAPTSSRPFAFAKLG
jgi:transposase